MGTLYYFCYILWLWNYFKIKRTITFEWMKVLALWIRGYCRGGSKFLKQWRGTVSRGSGRQPPHRQRTLAPGTGVSQGWPASLQQCSLFWVGRVHVEGFLPASLWLRPLRLCCYWGNRTERQSGLASSLFLQAQSPRQWFLRIVPLLRLSKLSSIA